MSMRNAGNPRTATRRPGVANPTSSRTRRGAFGPVFLTAIALLLFNWLALGSASGAVIENDRPLLFRFDGSGSSLGPFESVGSLAIEQSTGDVFVLNLAGSGQGPGEFDSKRAVCKFDAEGSPVDFAATGESCLDGSETPSGAFGIEGFFERGSAREDVAIDNSGGSGAPGEGEQGRIYVSEEVGSVHAFTPAGHYLWTLHPSATGIDVDAEGHLWVADNDESKVLEFANSGSPPAKIGEFTTSSPPCHLAVNGEDVYLGLCGTVSSSTAKYVAGAFDSTLSPVGRPQAIAVDSSAPSGHIFGTFPAASSSGFDFKEYEPCGTAGCPGSEVTGSPFGAEVLGSRRLGIDFNPSEDWVYVASGATFAQRVDVFGPVTSGSAPDATTGETTGITRTEAVAHGTIDPGGLPNTYRLELKRCANVQCSSNEDQGWGSGMPVEEGCTPAPPLPEDSVNHQVSCELEGLLTNTWYQVRLVATNTENHLSEYSSPDQFKTLPPPAPSVTGCAVTAITTSSAHLGGCLVQTEEDETTWQVRRAARPGFDQAQCAALPESKFSTVEEETIPAGETTPVPVAADLTDLLPAQTNCVRVVATNSGGTGQQDLVFETVAVAPSEAETSFTAPRTDTTARIDARIDPEGEATLSYRFELSTDGVNWVPLPLQESDVPAWEQIVVGEDLSGLEPDTTYRYRLVLAENEAGAATIGAVERSFTTRSSAELALPPNALGEDDRRGIELVNQPDDGNQNVQMFGTYFGEGHALITSDGNEAVWNVFAGVPGAPNAAENAFLARRGADGWTSSPIAPPAGEQYGNGAIYPKILAATPSLSSFVTVFGGETGWGLARFEGRTQDLLAVVQNKGIDTKAIDVTDDGKRVLVQNDETGQIEDFGDGSPEVVSIMPDGNPSVCRMVAVEGSSFIGTSNDASGAGRYWHPGYHMISTTDASQVYFQAKSNGSGCGASVPLALYVRNRESGQTTLIDPGSGSSEPHFIRSTPDGRTAYFVTEGQCSKYNQLAETCEKAESKDTNGHADVYRWEEKTGKSVCVTCALENETGAAVTDVDISNAQLGVAISDDFSHIYLESPRALDPGAVPGGRNIYAASGGVVRFVANIEKSHFAEAGVATAEISADGGTMLFRAVAGQGLTADRIAGECTEPSGKQTECIKLYRYEDSTGGLECLACAAGKVSSHVSFDDTDRVSADGSTAAFTTPEALLPGDVNNGNDAYEWRNGALRLITDGRSSFPEPPYAAPKITAVDGSGENIFFTVDAPGLTGFELSGFANAYDARIGGGFAPPSASPGCSGESCQGSLAPPPAQRPPATQSFAGHGNLAATGGIARCAKGKARRSGRCVRKRHRHRRHGQAHPRGRSPR
jgi:hypothetical protein